MINAQTIKNAATTAGFDACGIAQATPVDTRNAQALTEWTANGRHASMAYMERTAAMRLHPQRWWQQAQSIVALLWQYMPQKWQDPLLPQIAAFAYGEDYHSLLHRKLLQVLHTLKETYPHLEGRIAVDTSPLLERYWAVQAGLGYIGKNALLINPVVGSFVFIGIIALNQATDAYDMPMPQNACSRCRRCIEQCPARAILRPRVIDARRCISYQTQYGYKKHTDATSVAACGYIWGCDICQRVCPKNQNVHPKNNPEWQLHHKLISLTANDWRRMSAEEFALLTKDSTMKRADFNTIKMSL